MPASVAAAILDGFGLLSPTPAAPVPLPPVLSWPMVVSGLVEGTVTAGVAGWAQTAAPHARVAVFAGPEVTVRQLGAAVQPWLAAITNPGHPVPAAVDVARAILAYNAGDLGVESLVTSSAAVSPARFPGWQVGQAVPLPIEFDPTAAVPQFVTDLTVWATLAATDGTAHDALLDYLPEPLAIPDPRADAAAAASLLATVTQPVDLCAGLRLATLQNPSGQVMRALALLQAIDAQASGEPEFLTTLVSSSFSADELELLASVTPGAIVLRALYRRLAAAPPGSDVTTAVGALNAALGLPSGSSADLTQHGPAVVARELAASAAWQQRPDATHHVAYDANGERTDGYHGVVLGRALYCGQVGTCRVKQQTTPVTYLSFTGPAHRGSARMQAATFIAASQSDINAGADPKLAARLQVVGAIAGNEGNVDAVRLQDGAILALGIQQWSANSDDELTPLLQQFLQQAPDEFDAHFGVYGLGLDVSATLSDGTPGTVTMHSIPPGGDAIAMPAVTASHPETPAGRLAFFGGSGPVSLAYTFVASDGTVSPWAARVRSAELCSRTLQLLEIAEAARRFTKIKDAGWMFPLTAGQYPVDTLITSVRGAAFLLDQHINTPDHTRADLQSAFHAAGAVAVNPDGSPAAGWLQGFETAYQAKIRYPNDDVNQTIKTTRQGRITAASLPATPGSFGGW